MSSNSQTGKIMTYIRQNFVRVTNIHRRLNNKCVSLIVENTIDAAVIALRSNNENIQSHIKEIVLTTCAYTNNKDSCCCRIGVPYHLGSSVQDCSDQLTGRSLDQTSGSRVT